MVRSESDALLIGALSNRTGCNIETIRYYERVGVMPRPERTAGGHRLYNLDAVKRLTFILRCRALGFSLEEVRGLLRLVDGGVYTCAEVRALTLAHLETVRAKIVDLGRLEQTLADTVAACDGRAVPECPFIDALRDG